MTVSDCQAALKLGISCQIEIFWYRIGELRGMSASQWVIKLSECLGNLSYKNFVVGTNETLIFTYAILTKNQNMSLVYPGLGWNLLLITL